MIFVLGAGLLTLTALGGWLAAGVQGLIAAGSAGLVGLGAHTAGAIWIRRNFNAELKKFAAAMVGGMAIRLAGAGVVVAAVLMNETVFLPAPTLFGYVAVLVPMLLMEIRFLK
jgi:hypothetical protein